MFRGRGEHPKMGKIKQRVYPRDITINIGKEAPVPEHPYPGQKWKEVSLAGAGQPYLASMPILLCEAVVGVFSLHARRPAGRELASAALPVLVPKSQPPSCCRYDMTILSRG